MTWFDMLAELGSLIRKDLFFVYQNLIKA